MRPIDADALGDITITIDGTVFVRYEDIMNEPTIFNENDLIEIEHRFGNFVRFVIEDIMRGKEERWGDEVSEDDQDIVVADEAYANYKANPKTYTLGEIIEMNDSSIDATPKRGRWIKEKNRRNHWHCSECKYVIGVMKMDANYCPKCGAKMQNE